MFGKKIKIFNLFGFEVYIDLSWLVLAVLITWSLADGLFPYLYSGLSVEAYWWMGFAGAAGLLFSIVFHELSHSLVARRFGLPIKGITLFIFGGVAEMSEQPESPRVEFWMAVAGPLASILLALTFYAVYLLSLQAGLPTAITGVANYLFYLNGLLAVFNLVPAFPLDGGRVLRAALWKWKHDIRWATRISSQAGSLFGIVLIVLGVFQVLQGNFVGGMWWFLIGLFLRGAANMSYRQLVVKQMLEGESVDHFMNDSPVTVPAMTTLAELVDKYIYKHHFKMFPVVSDSNLVGCVTTRQVREIPREEWDQHTVNEIAGQCSLENTVSPDSDALEAMKLMSEEGKSRLMVVDHNHLVGIVTLKDLMRFLSIKMDLDQAATRSP